MNTWEKFILIQELQKFIAVLNNNLEKHIVKNGINGYVVNSIHDFKDKITFLYDNKNAEKLGVAAREFVMREYSVEKNMSIYHGVCSDAMFADKVIYENTVDYEKILEVAKAEKIDGIVTAGTDVAVITIGKVCDELGLSGISFEAAKVASNKILMKRIWLLKEKLSM